MPSDILTKEELAELLQVTVRTIDNLRKKGMPFFKVGDKVRFNKEKVLKWLEEQESNSSK